VSELPAPAPSVYADAKPFWDATKDGRVVVQRCTGCGTVVWYPRAFCPCCTAGELEWFEASGRGTVYSFTIVRRGAGGPYRDVGSYALAIVELDEGPRLLTNLVECDLESIGVGDAVEAVFHPTADGPALVRFRPLAAR
jgi:uncharacterized OB-fold protein